MDFLTENCRFCRISDDLKQSLAVFSCSKSEKIESFFRNEAVDYSKQMMGQSYAFVEKDSNAVVCAFCVACASVSTAEMPKKFRNKMNRLVPYVKQRDTYPAVLLAQIAIDDKYAELHLGDKLISLIKTWIVLYASQIAGRYLIVDAINIPKVIEFYQRNKFKMVFASEAEERMSCDMEDDVPLETRFMIADLIDVKNNLN